MSKTFQTKELEKAYVLIKCKADLETYVLDHLERVNGVKKVEYTVGTGCILVGIIAYTYEGLCKTIASKIQTIPQIYSTTTLICGQTCMEEGVSYEQM
jgi:DNA-binding Lrp family transcriptional regulator